MQIRRSPNKIIQDKCESLRRGDLVNNKSVDFSKYLDFKEIEFFVEKLRNWTSLYGPLEEIDSNYAETEPQGHVWSEVSDDDEVALFSGFVPRAERFFLSKTALIVDQDSPVTTAYFFSCPICEDALVDQDGETTESCPECGFNRKLFLDLEDLLGDSSINSINKHIEPA